MTEPAAPRTFLVTGASTGIGRCIAERLAGQGNHVFASTRKPADLQALGDIAQVVPVPLDVVQPLAVAASVATAIGANGAAGNRRLSPPDLVARLDAQLAARR